jgi:hypothetical protein
MHDRDAEPPGLVEHAGGLGHDVLEPVRVLERHERDHAVERSVRERQRGGVRLVDGDLGVGGSGRLHHRGRTVDARDVVANPAQVA